MNPQNRLPLGATALLLLLCLGTVAAEDSVGVKKGDWIEFNVVTTGTPEEGHDVTWARMEILDVQGQDISVNVTTKAANGTFASGVMVLNPAEGKVGVWFIIPPNLKPGESFYDASENQTVIIEGSEQRTIAGATRTVTHASTPQRIKSWDQATGVFVESIDVLPDYTLNATAYATNLWSVKILGVDAGVFYVVIGFVAVVTVTVALAIGLKRKPKKNQTQT